MPRRAARGRDLASEITRDSHEIGLEFAAEIAAEIAPSKVPLSPHPRPTRPAGAQVHHLLQAKDQHAVT